MPRKDDLKTLLREQEQLALERLDQHLWKEAKGNHRTYFDLCCSVYKDLNESAYHDPKFRYILELCFSKLIQEELIWWKRIMENADGEQFEEYLAISHLRIFKEEAKLKSPVVQRVQLFDKILNILGIIAIVIVLIICGGIIFGETELDLVANRWMQLGFGFSILVYITTVYRSFQK